MHIARPRRVAVLLAVLALLVAALPTATAAAAPPMTDRPVASETGVRVPLAHAVAAWFTSLWSRFGPQAVWEDLGIVADPGGAPQAAWEELGPVLDPGGSPEPASAAPTATPQSGSGLDPNS